ncbi:glycosyltransferase family 2 protein [Porphyromonas miyakawae]|uniref:Glycosyltransferase family 2 protein n=1 Tax=Porphyromonas miyakawae TaxID=3137470 RepID=A0ABQ0E3P2_9PORP
MLQEKQFPYDLSIVIPLLNEAESLPFLQERIEATMKAAEMCYEVIYIDDGSTDNSWSVIKSLHAAYPERIKALRFVRNNGKSAALQCGFTKAAGRLVATMDADLQDAPEELPAMCRMIYEENLDLVSGWKKTRYDPKLTKNLPSKLFNATARRVSGIHNLHDFNCGIKVYRQEVIKSIELYNDMHRYIPIMAKDAGYARIGEKEVKHAPRTYGHSKFGINRFFHGYLDLLTLWFMSRFGRRPMHFFGFWGSIIFLIGIIALLVVFVIKLVALTRGVAAPLVTDRVYFFIAITAMIIGTQLFTAGFIGEILSRNALNRNQYNIKEEL